MSGQVLHWGIKKSLLEYLTEVEANIEVTPPAGRPADSFMFPLRTAEESEGQRIERFEGAVRIVAHGGLMDITLRSPSLRLSGDSGVLEVAGGDAPIAVVKLSALQPTLSTERRWTATLTSDGSRLFGGNYPGGTLMDEVVIKRPSVK